MVDLDFGRLVPAFFRALMLSYSPRFFISLAVPSLSAPIVCRKFVRCSLDSARTSAVAFLSGGLILFNGHGGVAKPDKLDLIPAFSQDRELLRAIGCAFRLVIATELFSSVFYAHIIYWLVVFRSYTTDAPDRSGGNEYPPRPVSQ